MTRALAGIVMGLAIAAILYLATMRTERHPMLIDAQWCDPKPPLIEAPRRYDHQMRKRMIGAVA